MEDLQQYLEYQFASNYNRIRKGKHYAQQCMRQFALNGETIHTRSVTLHSERNNYQSYNEKTTSS